MRQTHTTKLSLREAGGLARYLDDQAAGCSTRSRYYFFRSDIQSIMQSDATALLGLYGFRVPASTLHSVLMIS